MALTLLTELEAADYVSALDLADGSEAQRTIGTMMLLPAEAFIKAISALAQGLISFHNIRTLPAMNERMLDNLIGGALGSTDETTIAWRYRNEWLPNSIDVEAMRIGALGDPKVAVSARFIDLWGGIIRPKYDFLGVDETKFHLYNEAYIAYMIIATSREVQDLISSFVDTHNQLRINHPDLLQDEDKNCPVLSTVLSLSKQAVFLERATGGRLSNPLLNWIMSGSWRYIEPGHYKKFMNEVAYPTLARADDEAHTGIPGAIQLYEDAVWSPIAKVDSGWLLDKCRLARLHFAKAYGINSPDDTTKDNALRSYLENAFTVITKVHEVLATHMGFSAMKYRSQTGMPVGLLLCLTYTK